jgi:uncharacterized glyoxalase superfamily protein PhnB
MAVNPIPDGYRTVTPYLVVEGLNKVINFLKSAFNAETKSCVTQPDGSIAHAEVKIGDSFVMLGEARPPWQPMPGAIYLYVDDTDAWYHRAMQAGGTSLLEPADMFYGDRNAGVKDPAGNYWWIATHKEDVPPDEIQRRAAAFHK